MAWPIAAATAVAHPALHEIDRGPDFMLGKGASLELRGVSKLKLRGVSAAALLCLLSVTLTLVPDRVKSRLPPTGLCPLACAHWAISAT